MQNQEGGGAPEGADGGEYLLIRGDELVLTVFLPATEPLPFPQGSPVVTYSRLDRGRTASGPKWPGVRPVTDQSGTSETRSIDPARASAGRRRLDDNFLLSSSIMVHKVTGDVFARSGMDVLMMTAEAATRRGVQLDVDEVSLRHRKAVPGGCSRACSNAPVMSRYSRLQFDSRILANRRRRAAGQLSHPILSELLNHQAPGSRCGTPPKSLSTTFFLGSASSTRSRWPSATYRPEIGYHHHSPHHPHPAPRAPASHGPVRHPTHRQPRTRDPGTDPGHTNLARYRCRRVIAHWPS